MKSLAAMFKGRHPIEVMLWSVFTAGLFFSMISISLAQVFLGLALVFWMILLVGGKRRLVFPAFVWPLAVYVVLSLVASALSRDPATSFIDSKELLLTLIVPLVLGVYFSAEALTASLWVLLASAAAASLYPLILTLVDSDSPQRLAGFMGHYMTQAGLLMLFGSVALSLFIFLRDRNRWVWASGLALSLPALALTMTRSSWIGLAAAACLILLLYKPKTLIVVPLLAGLFFLVAPKPMKQRALSIFSAYGYSNQDRIAYIKAGVKIIKENPLHGTGPDTVDKVFQYPEYGLSEQAKKNVHLHNNLIQIAAERGLPALAAWLAFLVAAVLGLLRVFRTSSGLAKALAAGVLAVIAALFIGGMFEYNFGDSEITSLFYILVTLPFVPAPESLRGGPRGPR